MKETLHLCQNRFASRNIEATYDPAARAKERTQRQILPKEILRKKKACACHFPVFKDVLLKCNTVEESGIL